MTLQAKDIMEPRVVSVPPEMPLEQFEEFLSIQNIDGAPVQNAAGEIVGIASKTDVIRALRFQSRGVSPEKVTVADIMTDNVVFVPPDLSPPEVAELMIDQGIHRVLVGDRQHVRGIITAFDLLRLVR
ncbi:transcriptional regulator [Methylomarinovum caldicuralii]|uniref:Transcriptional regulator n=1 Tax=Methylomarinovum caldicuralii TaxID=438856 RepID=A0AAU9BVK0_9GAMM|nr:CBS domain-containing protein [Methylomarinovum caldicuralii]BCX82781.1 transcriptional regulator [Methylomarinovum caldicuralii]